MDACLIIIGDEILSGRTRDANLQYLATWLGELGIRLAEARVIRDDPETIIETVNTCRSAFGYVFTTGGIGPTHDDRTSEAVARAFGVELELDARAEGWLRDYYGADGLNPSRLKMARVPAGADLLENPISRAPGFRLDNVFVLPGIPKLVQAMLEYARPFLIGGEPMRSQTVRGLIRESAIADELGRFQQRHADVEIGSYPFFEGERPGVALVVRANAETAVSAASSALATLLRELGADSVVVL